MSRSGYTDDYEGSDWAHICWRGAVSSALRGKRGRAFLEEMARALDAMPVKELIAHELVMPRTYCEHVLAEQAPSVCAIGSVAVARGQDVSELDPENYDAVAKAFGIAPAMVREIVYLNDEAWWEGADGAAGRWHRVRDWVREQLGAA